VISSGSVAGGVSGAASFSGPSRDGAARRIRAGRSKGGIEREREGAGAVAVIRSASLRNIVVGVRVP